MNFPTGTPGPSVHWDFTQPVPVPIQPGYLGALLTHKRLSVLEAARRMQVSSRTMRRWMTWQGGPHFAPDPLKLEALRSGLV